jgi:hypothetical protein
VRIYILASIVALFAVCSNAIATPKDSLVLINKDVMVGEIKQMDRGVLTMKTPYSDKDFLIEWYGISEIYSQSVFLITLRDGRRYDGKVQSLAGTNRISIMTTDSQLVVITNRELVFLKVLESKFWGRMKGNIDFGLNFTKANNLRQFSARSSIAYLAKNWQVDGYFNSNFSVQDSVEAIKRTEGGAKYTYFLNGDWYVGGSLNFLSNTEQALELRTTAKFGGGKLLLHTNRRYWGAGLGLSLLNESFFNETPSRVSAEVYAGSELNLFDMGDFSLLTNVYVFKSITESQRWRCDFKLDAKYDIFNDFYLKPGITLNYDNRPAAVGRDLDYVFVFNIGWEFD